MDHFDSVAQLLARKTTDTPVFCFFPQRFRAAHGGQKTAPGMAFNHGLAFTRSCQHQRVQQRGGLSKKSGQLHGVVFGDEMGRLDLDQTRCVLLGVGIIDALGFEEHQRRTRVQGRGQFGRQ